MAADPAQNAEAGLNEERCFHQSTVQEMGKIIEVARVIAFKLEPRSKGGEQRKQPLNVLIAVLEHQIARCLKHLRFPLIFEILVAIQHGKQAKAHRPHVERSNLGSEPRGRTQAFFQRHGGMSSGCRSEEHTSELQSLMRISYAVFCLKKKNNNIPQTL